MNRLLAIAVLAASVSIASTALAAGGSADKLIEEGLHLRRDGRPADALELFRQAHAIAPSARTFGQMGLVEASLRQWVEAENHLSVSLANPDDAWVRKNRAFLDEALSLCQRHVGDLVISGAAGVEVFVDGRSMGTLPAVPALRLPEGTVTVTGSAPGFQPFERTVSIQAGVRTPLAILLIPIAATPLPTVPVVPKAPAAAPPPSVPMVSNPPTPATETKSGSWHTWAGVSLMAAGVAALGFGITWIVVDGQCPHDKVCAEMGGMMPNSGYYKTGTVGWIAAGVGAATAAAGAVTFFTREAASGSKVAVGLTPSSLLLQGQF